MITFEAVAEVCGRSILHRLAGLVPCYPVCCLLQPRFPGDCVSPPLPIPLGTAHNGCVALSSQIRLIFVPLHHEPIGCFEDPPGTACPPPLLQQPTWYAAISTTNAHGEYTVDPSAARNTLRPSTRHLCQVLGCPPGLQPFPPVTVANITRHPFG